MRGFSEVLVQFPKEGGSAGWRTKWRQRLCLLVAAVSFLVSSQVEVCDLGREGVFSKAIRKAET